ncbi:MAG TPA: DNRLRE domain-containing protein [Polyangiaceae bacterium]|nr:DNRLRE domain-containing protein [Polyangiaceae bacterium]
MAKRMNVQQASVLGRHASVWAAAAILAAFASSVTVTSCGNVAPEEVEFSGEEAAAQTRQALSVPVSVSFQDGVFPSADYAGTRDATLREAAGTSNFGGGASCEADGDDTAGSDESCAIRWDVGGIPPGSIVQAASLTLRVTNGSADTYDIYGLTRGWEEGEVSWQSAQAGTTWAAAGALGASDRGAVIGSVTGAAGTRTVSLNAAGIALVQSWVDGEANAGIVVAHATNSDGIGFGTRERATASERPRLDITYLPPETANAEIGAAPVSGEAVPTDPNLKIAFVGDTATGTNFRNVLTLIKNEAAAAVVVEGDMSYSANASSWWSDVESVLGTTFPVFISRGNHDDSSWSAYQAKANQHLGGATRVAGAHDANYKTTFRGLVIATIKKGDTASRINPFLSGDPHIWKICQWHQNQQALQVGSKTDEMGWAVYEACRQQGAIIQTGHEHSYSRTKTLTSMTNQTVDSTCASASSLCVGAGRTFANVVGLGGNSIRPQSRCTPFTPPYGCNGEWASIYTSDQGATHGAQFIVFSAGADKVATGYFKNINGQTVDTFTITHD